eukprot:g1184.t1
MGFTKLNVVVALVSVLPFLNTLYGEYVYDDKKAIVGNQDIREDHTMESVLRLLEHDFWGNPMPMMIHGNCGKPTTRGWTNNSFRPLSVLTFCWDCAMCGKSPICFHVSNIFFHAVSVILAARLARNMYLHSSSRKSFRESDFLGSAVALLFGVHPVRTEVVANITSRAEVVTVCFVFTAIIVYFERCLVSPRTLNATWLRWFGWCISLVFFGLLCKESALVAPAILFAVQVLYGEEEESSPNDNATAVEKTEKEASTSNQSLGTNSFVSYARSRCRVLRDDAPKCGAVLAFLLALFAFRLRLLSCGGGSGYHLDTLMFLHNAVSPIRDVMSRAMTAAYVQAKAMSMLWVPVGLSHEHAPIKPVESLFFDTRNLLTALMWSAFLATIFRFALRKGVESVRMLAVAIIVIGYLPASHLLMRVAFTLAERTLFLPSFGACVLSVEILRDALSLRSRDVSSASNFRCAIGALVCAYAAMSFRRNGDWANEAKLMQSNIDTYPENNYMSVFGLGAMQLYEGSSNLQSAASHLNRAAATSEDFNARFGYLVEDAYVMLSQMMWMYHANRDGVESEDAWFDDATRTLQRIHNSTRFRSLVMTNRGLLDYTVAAAEDSESKLYDAEYLIIAAASEESVRASLALEARMLSVVYNNAGCFRLLSPPTRWGHGAYVEPLFRAGIDQAELGGVKSTSELAVLYHNMAIAFAVSGRVADAIVTMQKAISVAPDRKSATALSWSDQLRILRDPELSEAIARSIASGDGQWVGPAADERIALFGGGCEVQLVWY